MVVEAEGLGKVYEGGVRGLDGLNLQMHQGEVLGLLGPNGAGKSTTVRLLNGTLTPTSGKVQVLGGDPSSVRARQASATLGETARMYGTLSVDENLRFFGTLCGMGPGDIRERGAALLKELGLDGLGKRRLDTFSTGMQKRVQLARVLLHRPALAFLDEPTSGLDPHSAREVTELIRRVAREQGTTVLLCTHNLPLAERICDRHVLLVQGRMVASGTLQELAALAGKKPFVRVRTPAGDMVRDLDPGAADMNALLRRLLDEGVSILEARREEPSLEDLFFALSGVESRAGGDKGGAA